MKKLLSCVLYIFQMRRICQNINDKLLYIMIFSLLWVISGCVVNNHNLPKQKSDFYDNNYTKNRKVTKKNRRDLNGFYNSVIHDFRTLAIADSFYDKDLIFYEFSNKKWGIIIDESSVYSIIVGQGKSLLGKYFSQKNDPYFDGAIPANYYGTDKEKRINELLCEMFSYTGGKTRCTRRGSVEVQVIFLVFSLLSLFFLIFLGKTKCAKSLICLTFPLIFDLISFPIFN